MEKIHKVIVIVLGAVLVGVMVIGLIYSANRKSNKDNKIKLDKYNLTTTTGKSTTTTPTTTTSDGEDTDLSTDTSEGEVSGVESDSTSKDESDKPTEFKIVARDVNVKVGKTEEIYIELGEGLKISDLEFSSTDKSIATVDEKGNVKGVDIGECKVKIKYNGEEVSVKVSVTDQYSTSTVSPREVYTNECHFREGPGVDYASKKVFALNTKVKIVGESGNWWKVEYGSMTGYVSKDYVSDSQYSTGTSSSSNSNSNASSSSKVNSSSSKKDNVTSSSKVDSSSSKKDDSSSKVDSSSTVDSSSNVEDSSSEVIDDNSSVEDNDNE